MSAVSGMDEHRQDLKDFKKEITKTISGLIREARHRGISGGEVREMLRTHLGRSPHEAHMDQFKKNVEGLTVDAIEAARSIKGIGCSD